MSSMRDHVKAMSDEVLAIELAGAHGACERLADARSAEGKLQRLDAQSYRLLLQSETTLRFVRKLNDSRKPPAPAPTNDKVVYLSVFKARKLLNAKVS